MICRPHHGDMSTAEKYKKMLISFDIYLSRMVLSIQFHSVPESNMIHINNKLFTWWFGSEVGPRWSFFSAYAWRTAIPKIWTTKCSSICSITKYKLHVCTDVGYMRVLSFAYKPSHAKFGNRITPCSRGSRFYWPLKSPGKFSTHLKRRCMQTSLFSQVYWLSSVSKFRFPLSTASAVVSMAHVPVEPGPAVVAAIAPVVLDQHMLRL